MVEKRKTTNKKPDEIDIIIEKQANLNPLAYLCNKRRQSVKDYKFMMRDLHTGNLLSKPRILPKNYCQFFKGNTEEQFSFDLESSFLFGQPFSDTLFSFYTTGGLKYWLDNSGSSNVEDADGVLKYENFNNWISKLTEVTGMESGQLVLLCGNKANSVLLGILDRNLAMPERNMFGFNTQTFTTSYAKISVHQHHLLTDGFENYIFAVNPKYIGTMVLQDEDATHQNERVHRRKISVNMGFYIDHPELHGYMKNVSDAV